MRSQDLGFHVIIEHILLCNYIDYSLVDVIQWWFCDNDFKLGPLEEIIIYDSIFNHAELYFLRC